jgi:septal ring factor EnvC (AmiA/AmiB activator)
LLGSYQECHQPNDSRQEHPRSRSEWYAPLEITTDLYSILLILAPPWPPSTTEDDKLSQILEHIKKLDRKVNVQDGVIAQLKDDNAALKADNTALHRKVNVQDGVIAQLKNDNTALKADNAALKADNAALKVRVGILEDDNQVLREAIDGVSTFAWLGRDVTHNQSTANGSSSQTSTPYPARSSSQEDPEPMGTSQS